MTCLYAAALTAAPGPAWIEARLHTPERVARAEVVGFTWDKPRAMAAAFNEVTRWIERGEIPRKLDVGGNRNELTFKFFARMHGLGLSEARAAQVYEFFLTASGGDAPDDWPDAKSDDQLYRIWAGIAGDNPPGSELPQTNAEIFKSAEPYRLSRSRLWTMEDLMSLTPISFWDTDKMMPKVQGGYVGVWFGKYGHHKTNLLLTKLFELMTKTDAKVLYLLGEGVGGMGARLAAHCISVGMTAAEFHSRFRSQEIPLMSDLEQIANLFDMLREEDYRPDVVVIDTMTTALAGMDEDNKTASMLTRRGAIGQLATALGALVILIGHEGDKAGKLRGGSGYYGNADYVLYIKANVDKDAIGLHVVTMKMRDGPADEWWYRIAHINGVPVPQSTTRQGYEMLTGDARFSPQSVAGALGRLDARSPEHGQATRVVVQELYPAQPDQDPEDWSRCIDKLALELEKAAKGDTLSGLFTNGEGRLSWFA